jgi:hypothetical protein
MITFQDRVCFVVLNKLTSYTNPLSTGLFNKNFALSLIDNPVVPACVQIMGWLNFVSSLGSLIPAVQFPP